MKVSAHTINRLISDRQVCHIKSKLLLSLGLMSVLQLLYPLTIKAEESPVVESAEIKISGLSAMISEGRNIELKEGSNKIFFENMHPGQILFEPLSEPNSIIFTEVRDVGYLVDGTETIDKEPSSLNRLKSDLYGPHRIFGTYDKIVLTPINTTKYRGANNKVYRDGRTLLCSVDLKEAGNHRMWICYSNHLIGWKCYYKAIIDNDDSKIDFSGQINIENKSRFTYKNADLKLEAINSIPHRIIIPTSWIICVGYSPPNPKKSYIEHHLYKVLEKIDLPSKTVVQLRSCDVFDTPVEKVFVYEPAKEPNIQVGLELVNSQKNNLGIPLAAGNIRIYKKNENGIVQFFGEEYLEHTPIDQKIRLYLNDAPGLIAKRAQFMDKTKPFCHPSIKARPYICEIDLENNKKEEVIVTCIEHLASGWKMVESNQPYTKCNSRTFEFAVKIPANSRKRITYRTDFDIRDLFYWD